MPAAVLTIDINARLASLEAAVAKIPGAFRNSTRGVESELDRIGKKLTGFGAAVLGGFGIPLGAGALVSFLQTVAQKAAEGERSVNQLNAVLKTTSGSAGLTRSQIDQIGEGIQAKTVFDDDAINAAATALLRFRKVQGDTFRDALQLAPDVAAALGIELPAAAQLLGRSLSEPESEIKAFKVAGVGLSEQLKDVTARMMENGNVAGAQKIRLEEIKRAIGGASEADNAGLYGSTKRLARSWDDMQKILGRATSNQTAIDGMTAGIDKINSLLTQTKTGLLDIITLGPRAFFAPGTINFGALGNLGSASQRTASGRIKGVKTPEEEAAEAAAQAERKRQIDEQRYLDSKASLTRLAAATAAVNQEKLVKLKAQLGAESALYDQAYRHNEIGVKEFYATQRREADITAQATLRALADEGEAIEKQAGAPGTNREEHAALEVRLRGIAVQQAQAQAEHQQKLVGISIQEAEAIRRLADEYEGLGIKLAELQGDDVGAANRSFVLANKDLLSRINAQLQSADPNARDRAAAALQEFNAVKSLVDVRSRLADAVKNYGLTIDGLAVAQDRIAIAEQSGAITNLEALDRRSELNKLYVGVLKDELATLEKIARESGRNEDLVKVQQMRVQMEALAAQTNLVADKFNSIGQGSASTFLQDLISGKGWKASLESLSQSLTSQISAVVSDSLTQKAFGKGGPLSGFGDVLAKLFGGEGGAGVGVVSTQLTALGATSTTTSTSLAVLTTSAEVASSALASLATSSGVQSAAGGFKGFGSFFDFGGGGGVVGGIPENFLMGGLAGFAVGTPFVPRDGIAKIHKGERIVPAAENRPGYGGAQSINFTQHIHVTGQVDSRTARQMAREAAAAIATARIRG